MEVIKNAKIRISLLKAQLKEAEEDLLKFQKLERAKVTNDCPMTLPTNMDGNLRESNIRVVFTPESIKIYDYENCIDYNSEDDMDYSMPGIKLIGEINKYNGFWCNGIYEGCSGGEESFLVDLVLDADPQRKLHKIKMQQLNAYMMERGFTY